MENEEKGTKDKRPKLPVCHGQRGLKEKKQKNDLVDIWFIRRLRKIASNIVFIFYGKSVEVDKSQLQLTKICRAFNEAFMLKIFHTVGIDIDLPDL